MALAVPVFLPALLHFSLFLSILAPIPLAWVNLARGRAWGLLASVSNLAVIWGLAGADGAVAFFVFAVASAWAVSEMSRYLVVKRGVVVSVPGREVISRRLFLLLLAGALAIVSVGGCLLLIWSGKNQVSVTAAVSQFLDAVLEQVKQQSSSAPGEELDWQELREGWLRHLPSTLVVASLIQAWVLVATLLRLNPGWVRTRLALPAWFHRSWRMPDWLVWPAILAGFIAIFLDGPQADLGLNVLRVCLALYGIQGVSILSAMLDQWRVRGFFRSLIFLLAFVFMLPLVLALGFFDLWFDFRSKLGQS